MASTGGIGDVAQENAERGVAFVRVLAAVLSRLVESNDETGTEPAEITKFHALRPPGISVADYLERIRKYASCSAECFVLALVYIDRLIQRNNLVLTSFNVHRVVITAVMLAAKFFDDHYYNNAYYARVGGVPCTEMNALELEFLFMINFSLHVPGEVFNRYADELASHLGTLSGTDIDRLQLLVTSAPRADEPEMLPGERERAALAAASEAGDDSGAGGGGADDASAASSAAAAAGTSAAAAGGGFAPHRQATVHHHHAQLTGDADFSSSAAAAYFPASASRGGAAMDDE